MRTEGAVLAVAVAFLAALVACGEPPRGGGAGRPGGGHGPTGDAGTGDAAGAPRPALVAPPGSLDAWFAALRRAEQGGADGRVLISIFGDSHTAGDALTGRLRAVLQARFGDAGRGLVAAGKPPYRHYYQQGLGYGSTGAWRAAVGGRSGDVEPFGLLGFRVEASRGAVEAWVESTVARFDVFYYGDLEYRVDAEKKWKKVATATAPRGDVVSITVPDGAHRLTVRRAKKGAIAIFGVALERERPGVVIDGLGVVGRRVGHLDQWDWNVIGPQLARRDPRLVILQYGTNEADDPELDLERVARQNDQVLARIRATVPNASVLVVGPPDMALRPGGKACDKLPPPPKPPPAGPAPDAAPVPVECEWHTPPALLAVIEVQRAAAARAGAAFFDSFAAMGGAERMATFTTSEPRLAYGDHVHFTAAGYQLWADALLAELLAAYEGG